RHGYDLLFVAGEPQSLQQNSRASLTHPPVYALNRESGVISREGHMSIKSLIALVVALVFDIARELI
ncbi:MAG: hypothetical protein ACE5IR_23770, partial [bacterium]